MPAPVQNADRLLLGAVRRWERTHGQRADLGADLSAQLSTCRTAGYHGHLLVEAGLLGHGLRLTMAGLRVVWASRTVQQIEERERARQASAAAEEQARAEQLAEQAAQAERARQLEALRFLDRLQDLVRELRGLREDLDALDACPVQEIRLAARAKNAPDFLLTCTTSSPARLREICRSRQATCRDPRHAPILRFLPGGLVEARKPSRAQIEAMRAFAEARAQGILFRAAKKWRLCWARYRWSEVPAGADLTEQLAGGKAFQRHWHRLMYPLGLVRHDAAPGAPIGERTRVLLTAAGAAWLAEQVQVPGVVACAA